MSLFSLQYLRLRAQHFLTKFPCQKLMLKQIEWEVENGPITKNRLLALTTLFFFEKLI